MNERIRELADRAGEYADFESGICTDEFMEKFAEMIVRECAQFIEDKFDFCGDELYAADELKKHFGVE